jgi:hypothetical protein
VALAFAKTNDERLRFSVARGKLGRIGEGLIAFLSNRVPDFNELARKPQLMAGFNVEKKFLAAMTVAEAINKTAKSVGRAKRFIEFVAEKDDREFISALFAFLEKRRRRDVFAAVKGNQVVLKALELTGRALL